MTIPFYKYQGTGNDFVVIDQRQTRYLSQSDEQKIKFLCDRRFGIGADGLILLENSPLPNVDFEMVYFNADGAESTMCGNGGRCLVAFAHFLQVFDNQCVFNAIDGLHEARINTEGVVEKPKNIGELRGINLDMDLSITEQAEMTLIFNEISGDNSSGSGRR
ncbi:MAG: hypothetical protein HC817_04815 [Saprospiraceae bacterium]|nr:hypothetical protein [Saprospiraceae bacterium]